MFRVFFFWIICLTPVWAIDANTGVLHAQKGDYKTAYNIWKVFAEEGDADSQFYLGVMYEKGTGVKQQIPQAIFWYIKAAEQKHARAHYNLGNLFFNGRGVSVDHQEAARRFELAAELGYQPAQFNLAYAYEKGLVGAKNPKAAFKWYLRAAEAGLVKAQIRVAKAYQAGDLTKQDNSKAIEWFERSLKKKETPEVRYHIGMIYLEEEATQEVGLRYLRLAAESGERLAQYQLGFAYGKGDVVKQDYEQATFWYKRAAKQQVADAQYLLCLSYSLGRGVPVDVVLAHVWCSAAEKNNVEGAADALQVVEESMTKKQLQAAAKVAPLLNPGG